MRIFFTLVLFFMMKSVTAQYIPVTSTIKTPYGNVNTTSYRYVPMHYGSGPASDKYTFTIELNSDSSLTSKTRIDVSEKQHSLQVKTETGKKTVFPSDTKQIYRLTTEGKMLTGQPADSCWLFKAVTGRINEYSHLAEEGYSYIIAIQDGDRAPILPLTRKNLEAMIATPDEPRIMKLIEKGKLVKALEMYNYERIK